MAAATTDWVGLELAGGRYQVKARLGEGGMASVYCAHDVSLDTEVVIKVPRAAMLGDPAFAGRFAREVRSLVRLIHPHIVRIHDVGEHEGTPYAVMQYLSGGSLRDRQSAVGPDGKPLPTPPDELGTWLEDIAAALDFIHRQGYVHRDVKPDNILFDAHGNSYLSDFGVAKVLADNRPATHRTVLTGGGFIFGTPHYMAPELLLGQPYDGRIDQYALAVMVYELLSGRHPFEGATPAAILVNQTSRSPQPLDEILPGFPRAAALAIQQGLLLEPDKRYPNCMAFARSVLQALGETSILDSPAPLTSRPGERTAADELAASSASEGTTTVTCPGCQRAFRLPIEAQGKRLRCGSCRRVFRISEATRGPLRPHPCPSFTGRGIRGDGGEPVDAERRKLADGKVSAPPTTNPPAALHPPAANREDRAGVDTQIRENDPTNQDPRYLPPSPLQAELSQEEAELQELRQAVFLNRLKKLLHLYDQMPGEGSKILAFVLGPAGGLLAGWAAFFLGKSITLIVFAALLTLVGIVGGLLWLYPFLRARTIRTAIEEIITKYPDEIRHWGGWPVLRDPVVVQELVRILEKRNK